MRRALLAFLFIIPFMQAHAQGIDRDAYLGVWETANKYDQIEVVKLDGLYYVIEFVRIKHELFFSGDNKRAVFQEWGKGPSGGVNGLVLSEDKKSIRNYSLTELGEWRATQYIFLKIR
jgi:hypothetical protein